MAFEPITINTQEELDKMFAERVERAKKSEAEKYKGFEDYKAKADKYDEDMKSKDGIIAAKDNEIASRDKDIADYKAKIAKFENDALRSKIASEFKLAPGLAGRLNGATEEELRKDAQELQQIVGTNNPSPLADPEPSRNDDSEDSYKSLVKKVRKNGGNE